MGRNSKMIDNCQDHKRESCLHGQSQLKNYADVSLTSNSHTAKMGDSFNLPSRKIGEDGHYYECVICGNGGELLCCDTCPCTFHLQCLNPPLESIAPGNWQCENCSEDADLVTPLRYLVSSKGNAPSNQNAVNHIGDKKGAEKVKEIKVYRRLAKKKEVEKEEDKDARKFTVVYGPEFANEDQKDKPPVDTSGLFNCSSIQPKSAEQANKDMEIDDMNASRPHQPKESSQKPVEERQVMNNSVCAHSPNINQYDSLWISRDVVQKSIKDHYFKQNKGREKQQALYPENTESGRARKEKFARLRARQKQKLAFRNRSRGLILSSGLGGHEPLKLYPEITVSERVHTSANGLKEHILPKPLLMKEKMTLSDQLHSKSLDQIYAHLNCFQNLSSIRDPRKLYYRHIKFGQLPCFSFHQASDARFSEINLNNNKLKKLDPPAVPQGGLIHPRSSASNFSSTQQSRENVDSMMLKMSNYLGKDDGMVDVWLEEELDSLWIGIRRHGQGNWEVMLRDPLLTFSKHKTTNDLSRRWNKERLKILNPRGSLSSMFRDSTDRKKNNSQVLDATLPILKDQLPSSRGKRVQKNLLVGGLINVPMVKIDSEASEDWSQIHQHEEKERSSEGTISD